MKNGKGNKSYSKSESDKYGKKCDMSRVKCFHCHKHGHYATNCPQKKKNKKASESAAGEALASQFELDFSLIACMVSSAMRSVSYLDNGASFHIMGDKELFRAWRRRTSRCISKWVMMGDTMLPGMLKLPSRDSQVNPSY